MIDRLDEVANDHADSFTKIDAPSGSAPAQAPRVDRKTVQNDAQAAVAEQQREYTAGGGGDEGGTTPPAEASPAAAAIERAIARVRAPERPSPFGAGQFPPLPAPPTRGAR